MTKDERPQPPGLDEMQIAAMRAAMKRIDQVNDWLHLGAALPGPDLPRLRDAGITHVVDLREDTEVAANPARPEDLGIARRQVAVANHSVPTTDQLVEVARWIGPENAGGKVYVHCVGGFGRAATVSVGLLVLSGTDLDEAVRQVQQARPEIRLNEEQLAWLHTVEDQRLGTGPRPTS